MLLEAREQAASMLQAHCVLPDTTELVAPLGADCFNLQWSHESMTNTLDYTGEVTLYQPMARNIIKSV